MIKENKIEKKFNMEIAPSVGMDSKNDIFAESILLNFKNLAVVKVIPDLLTPGIKDRV